MKRHIVFLTTVLMLVSTVFVSLTFSAGKELGINSYSQELEQINRAIAEKGAKWIAGETSMSHFYGKTGGLTSFQITTDANARMIHLPPVLNLPEKFDWRDNNGNWTTPVRNQDDPPISSDVSGYCLSFASIAQVEAWWKIKYNDPDTLIDLSEQWVISNLGYPLCRDINMLMGFLTETGVPLENCFPYQANHTIPVSNACPNWEESAVKIPGWGFITVGGEDIDVIKSALLRHPLTIAYDVYQDFLSYQSGVYENVWGNPLTDPGHTVLLVGWDDADSCWICENNWGMDWGETADFQPHTPGAGNGGYFRIKYGECNIGIYTWFIWDEMTTQEAFAVSPQHFQLDTTWGDTISYDYHLKNNGTPTVEYSAVLHETNVQSKFHLTEFQAWDGLSWWCGDPNLSGYGNYWLQYLDLPIMDISTTTNPKLTFMGKWALDDPGFFVSGLPYDGKDGCNVWISTDGGKQFDVIQPVSPAYNCNNLYGFGGYSWGQGLNIPGWAGIVAEWLPVEFNLSGYESDSMVIRFAFASDEYFSTNENSALKGLFIDDIKIMDDQSVFYQNDGDSLTSVSYTGYCGNKKPDWLTVSNGGGYIASHDSTIVTIHIDTRLLEPGNYSGIVRFAYNDSAMMPYLPTPRFTQFFLKIHPSTSIDLVQNSIPAKWQLFQNYPNPFNPTTIISYQLPVRWPDGPAVSQVELSIYNILGQKVAMLVSKKQAAGIYKVEWDATGFSSGVYLYRLETEMGLMQARKLVLMK